MSATLSFSALTMVTGTEYTSRKLFPFLIHPKRGLQPVDFKFSLCKLEMEVAKIMMALQNKLL
jgi:hypothetical protein